MTCISFSCLYSSILIWIFQKNIFSCPRHLISIYFLVSNKRYLHFWGKKQWILTKIRHEIYIIFLHNVINSYTTQTLSLLRFLRLQPQHSDSHTPWGWEACSTLILTIFMTWSNNNKINKDSTLPKDLHLWSYVILRLAWGCLTSIGGVIIYQERSKTPICISYYLKCRILQNNMNIQCTNPCANGTKFITVHVITVCIWTFCGLPPFTESLIKWVLLFCKSKAINDVQIPWAAFRYMNSHYACVVAVLHPQHFLLAHKQRQKWGFMNSSPANWSFHIFLFLFTLLFLSFFFYKQVAKDNFHLVISHIRTTSKHTFASSLYFHRYDSGCVCLYVV